MRKIIQLLIAAFLTSTILSCATTLTPEGQLVNLVTKKEAPAECELIDDVGTGFSGKIDANSVKKTLRNQTAELGGNLVVVDTIEAHSGPDGTFYKGTGRAYKCPQINVNLR